MTDVELDERVTALEENGGGDSLNGKTTVSNKLTHRLDSNQGSDCVIIST